MLTHLVPTTEFVKLVDNLEEEIEHSYDKIRNYAEGFEIGISALEAGMKWHFNNAFGHFLQNCFEFETKYGQKHIRF